MTVMYILTDVNGLQSDIFSSGVCTVCNNGIMDTTKTVSYYVNLTIVTATAPKNL